MFRFFLVYFIITHIFQAPIPQQPKPQQPGEVAKPVTAKQPHVMLSYNWGVQPIVLKLAAALKKEGYNVWLDIEQMQGSTLEAST